MGLLDGKVGLVTGIANDRSYAWHIAKALREHGATCGYTHLPGEKNERRTGRAVESLGESDPWLHGMDAFQDADIDAALEAYASRFGRMDFLIHSIAYAERDWLQIGSFTDTPREAYLQAIDVSAYTLLGMTRAARPLMVDSGGGSILGMSYYGAEKVVPGYNVMGVAKAALECTARYLASELGEQGIRVNTISGGYLRTLAVTAVAGADRIAEHAASRSPLKRGVDGSDVGKTAVYLVSDLSSGVTGETVYVDCGVNTIGV